MKKAIIRFLLRLLGHPVPALPEFRFYAVVTSGVRVADVTTNRNRACALAREQEAKGAVVQLWRCSPVDEESFR